MTDETSDTSGENQSIPQQNQETITQKPLKPNTNIEAPEFTMIIESFDPTRVDNDDE